MRKDGGSRFLAGYHLENRRVIRSVLIILSPHSLKSDSMNFSEIFRVPETERLKLAVLLFPFAIFFLFVGVVGGIDYLERIHFHGPRWYFPSATLAAIYLTSLGLAYLAFWHRRSQYGANCNRHPYETA